MTAETRLILFDIDGTLVQTAGAGIRGMNAAFGALHGWHAALDGVPIAGRTDRAIVTDVFRAAGVEPTNEVIGALRDAYVGQLPVELARSATGPFGVLPGVRALLDQLAAKTDVHVALLTGNFEQGAAIKLGHFDLWRRFLFGAFGDDHVHRRDLVPVARDRCRSAGIDCGRSASLPTLAGSSPVPRGIRNPATLATPRNGRVET